MKKKINKEPMPKILVVDDDPSILSVINMRLSSRGFDVLPVENGPTALKLAGKTNVDLAVIDYQLNDEDGVVLMEKLHQIQQGLPVIILTAYGTISRAVDAMKRGACNYLAKPFDGEDLVLQISNCLDNNRASVLNNGGNRQKGDQEESPLIISRSKTMKKIIAKVIQVAVTDSNVLIEGESGTGKELIARCLHVNSKRSKGPFIAVNCAAIPESLLESELLGYEKGAFTGASHRREGLFARAHGGSFFFDEISELPLPMQAKLLRILEKREFYPLGSNRKVKVDVRIITASNQNLENCIKEGMFREDLFYRIRVIPIVLPPLRSRTEDILPLARHFMSVFSNKTGKKITAISPQAGRKLMTAKWHGNVRELENVIEYAVAMATDNEITPDLIDGHNSLKDNIPPLRSAKDTFERDYLIELMEINNGNVSHASEMANKHRADFYELLRKHGLAPMDFRNK